MLTDQAEESVEIELHHKHLPKVTEVEYIQYKPDASLVELQGPPSAFNAITAIARVIEQPTDD